METSYATKPWTQETAQEFVTRYNINREDETGLPAVRVVKREVSDWEPA